MELKENIIALRKQKNLSQGDLAEAMQVSRQSVSKWETGQSIPDLEKLVRMAQLFGVTLDELVGNVTLSIPETEPVVAPTATPTFSLQKILGVLFLGVGLLCGVLSFLLGPVLLLPGGWLLASGLICLLVKRHAGLWIGWGTLLPFMVLAPYYTGVLPLAIFHRSFYTSLLRHFSIQHILTLLPWVALLILLWITVRAIRNHR